MNHDIVARLSLDAGQRTIGELIQDREAAANEIQRLRKEVERLSEKLVAGRSPVMNQQEHIAVFPPGALIRLAEVCRLVGVSRSTLYKWMSEGLFPRPVRVSQHAVRWRLEDVHAWRDRLA